MCLMNIYWVPIRLGFIGVRKRNQLNVLLFYSVKWIKSSSLQWLPYYGRNRKVVKIVLKNNLTRNIQFFYQGLSAFLILNYDLRFNFPLFSLMFAFKFMLSFALIIFYFFLLHNEYFYLIYTSLLHR